jgi:hypothetical protein
VYCRKCGEKLDNGAVYCASCGEKISKPSAEVENINQPLTVVGPEKIPNEGYRFTFPHSSPENVAEKVANLFQDEDYRLEEGDFMSGIYGIGSGGTKRLLGGAFSKRYRFKIFIREINGETTLEIYKGMSGVSGGMIGIRRLNQEFERFREAIKRL